MLDFIAGLGRQRARGVKARKTGTRRERQRETFIINAKNEKKARDRMEGRCTYKRRMK